MKMEGRMRNWVVVRST